MNTTDFPIENLPFGVFDADGEPHVCTAIEDNILDLHGWLPEPALNAFMASGDVVETKQRIRKLLDTNAELIPMRDATMLMPVRIGDYTDFYASIHHATRVGAKFRPDNPLLPNYKWIPIGYHGRASSIVVSGTPVKRPNGQTRDDANAPPTFGPSKRLDYELELGAFIGRGNALGTPIAANEALDHVFGFCLVNDWSARDIQAWEYQPLGPFLAKNFATSISPWIVTLDALEPYRVQSQREDPVLPHLADDVAFDITVEVWLRSAKMNEPVRLSRGNFRDMYWTVAQLVAHHTSNGCNLQPGDLLASGTISGPAKESAGCLLELSPIELPNGETRNFLEDGDEVILRAYCERDGLPRIGFGECRGVITPAL
ncbi:MAG: fumarylacetoacetase [Acidobacteria bacterium]|nr:MAG: fumarylacetoacetase [Acidobacteriota bacterium]